MSNSRKSFEDELDELFAQPLPGSLPQKNEALDLGDLQRNGAAATSRSNPPQRESTAFSPATSGAIDPRVSATNSAPAIRLSAGSLMDHGNDDSFAPTQLHALDPLDSLDARNAQKSDYISAKRDGSVVAGSTEVQEQMAGSLWPARAQSKSSPRSKDPRTHRRSESDKANNMPSDSSKLIWWALATVVIVASSAGAWLAFQPSDNAVVQQRVNKPSFSEDMEKAQAVTGPQALTSEGMQTSAVLEQNATATATATATAAAAVAGSEQANNSLSTLNTAPVSQAVVEGTLSERSVQQVTAPSYTPPRPTANERRKPTARNLDSLLD